MQDSLLLKTVEEFLERFSVSADDGMIIALSGGADSMALLHAIYLLRQKASFPVLAAHVHHGLRGAEADRDAAFAKQACEQRAIPFEGLFADVAKQALDGESFEQAGRRVRYAFFEQLREKYGYRYILTAHTADDNLETVLFHLTRGSGLHGLCGILPAHNGILRPLLTCSRTAIEAFCHEQNIDFVTDSTNSDTRYSRNHIRHCVVPQLEALNPQVVEACMRMTADLADEDAFIETCTVQLLDKAARQKDCFSLDVLANAPEVLQKRAIKHIAEQAGGEPERKHILLALQLLRARSGVVQMPCGVSLKTVGDVLMVMSSASPPATPYFETPFSPGDTVVLGDVRYTAMCLSSEEWEMTRKIHKNVLHFVCDYDKITSALIARQRKTGDTIQTVGGVRKTLKKFLNEKKVPIQQRDRVPIICDANGVVLVVGFSCDERVKIESTTKRILLFCPEMDIKEEKSSGNT